MFHLARGYTCQTERNKEVLAAFCHGDATSEADDGFSLSLIYNSAVYELHWLERSSFIIFFPYVKDKNKAKQHKNNNKAGRDEQILTNRMNEREISSFGCLGHFNIYHQQ